MRTGAMAVVLSVLLTAAVAQEQRCVSSIRSIPFKRQSLPAEVRGQVPGQAFVRLVLPLSNQDQLTIYELGRREASGIETTDPNTHLLITRQGSSVFRLAFKNLPLFKNDDPEWGVSAVAMKTAHLCSADADLTYLVLQAGNSGGFYIALT